MKKKLKRFEKGKLYRNEVQVCEKGQGFGYEER